MPAPGEEGLDRADLLLRGRVLDLPTEGPLPEAPIYDACGAGVDTDGHVTQAGIAPRPYQDPHPRLYGAFAHSVRTVKFWAREGGKPIVLADDLDFGQMLWDAYAAETEAPGRDVPRDEIAAWGGLGLLAVSEDRAALERQLEQHWW